MPAHEESDSEMALAEIMQKVRDQELDELTVQHQKEMETDPASLRQMHEHWEQMFGRKIRLQRQARSWSQEDLARKLQEQGFDFHQTTVAKLERGARPLRVAEAAALALIFRLPPLAVFHGPGPEDPPASWALNQLQESLTLAEENANYMKTMMEDAAKRYVNQQAAVYDYARIISDVAARAQKEADARNGEDGEHEPTT
jgi:transcriptional regulator with XRE-family HTH domain